MKEKRMYDSVRWRKASKMFLAENPLCAICALLGKDTAATLVDHVKPHNDDYYLFWDQDNWQPLCSSCHSGVKRFKDNRGIMPGCDINGLPLDGEHRWKRKTI